MYMDRVLFAAATEWYFVGPTFGEPFIESIAEKL